MGKMISNKCKMSRRALSDLFLKARGARDLDTKCKLNVLPGQHGFKKKKNSNYGIQLKCKQKIKYIYGILEKQFFLYYIKGLRSNGETGENILFLLERRLDNVVYRMGFASTRAESRQLINHKLILVSMESRLFNIVSKPSYLVKAGNFIKIVESAKKYQRIKDALYYANEEGFVKWVSVDVVKMEGSLIRIPNCEEFHDKLNEKLVVELYSK